MLGSQAILHTDELLEVFHAHGSWALQVASMRHLQKKEQVPSSVVLGAKSLNQHTTETLCLPVCLPARLLNRLR